MTGLPEGSDASLEVLRAELRAEAAETVRSIAADSERLVAQTLAAADSEAARIRAAAAEEGAISAGAAARLNSARARRRANETILRARNAAREDLQAQLGVAAVGIRTDPRYPELLEALRVLARRALGDEAVVSESPDGGVIGASGSRRVDLSLPTIAARALSEMTSEVEGLWMR